MNPLVPPLKEEGCHFLIKGDPDTVEMWRWKDGVWVGAADYYSKWAPEVMSRMGYTYLCKSAGAAAENEILLKTHGATSKISAKTRACYPKTVTNAACGLVRNAHEKISVVVWIHQIGGAGFFGLHKPSAEEKETLENLWKKSISDYFKRMHVEEKIGLEADTHAYGPCGCCDPKYQIHASTCSNWGGCACC